MALARGYTYNIDIGNSYHMIPYPKFEVNLQQTGCKETSNFQRQIIKKVSYFNLKSL